MKHIYIHFLSVILCALLVASVLPLSAVAESFSLNELSSCGFTSLQGACVSTPPVRDGSISKEEYGAVSEVTLSSGLSLCSFGGVYEVKSEDITSLNVTKIAERIAVAYDADFFYIGIEAELNDEALVAPVNHSKIGPSYFVSFSLGLSSKSDLYSKTANVVNQYFFSPDDFSCLAMSGVRTKRASDGEKAALYLLGDPTLERPFEDENGRSWTSKRYEDEAKLAVSTVQGGKRICFEARVPRGDALRCLSETDARRVDRLLNERSETFVAAVSAELALSDAIQPVNGDAPLSLLLGTPMTAPSPLSEAGESWQDYLGRTDSRAATATEVLPMPIYLSGIAPARNPNVGENAPTPSDPPVSNVTTTTSPTVTTTFSDDFLSRLPDEDRVLPEDVEILYDGEKTEEIEGEQGSVLGSVLLFLSGLFLFLSVIGAAILLRIRENKEKTSKKSLKKDK